MTAEHPDREPDHISAGEHGLVMRWEGRNEEGEAHPWEGLLVFPLSGMGVSEIDHSIMGNAVVLRPILETAAGHSSMADLGYIMGWGQFCDLVAMLQDTIDESTQERGPDGR